MNGLLEDLVQFKTGRSKRISSYDHTAGRKKLAPPSNVKIARRELDAQEKMLNRRKKRK